MDVEGTKEDGESKCGRGPYKRPELWATVDTKAFSDWTAIHGHVPASAVSVRITWADRGTAGPVEVDGKRYLVTYARYGDRDPLAWSAYTVQAPDARGRVVAEERPDN